MLCCVREHCVHDAQWHFHPSWPCTDFTITLSFIAQYFLSILQFVSVLILNGKKVLLSLAQTQFWNKLMNYVSRDRTCLPILARVVWFGSISVDISLIYEEEKIRRKVCYKIKNKKNYVKEGFALVLAPSSAVYWSPLWTFFSLSIFCCFKNLVY